MGDLLRKQNTKAWERAMDRSARGRGWSMREQSSSAREDELIQELALHPSHRLKEQGRLIPTPSLIDPQEQQEHNEEEKPQKEDEDIPPKIRTRGRSPPSPPTYKEDGKQSSSDDNETAASSSCIVPVLRDDPSPERTSVFLYRAFLTRERLDFARPREITQQEAAVANYNRECEQWKKPSWDGDWTPTNENEFGLKEAREKELDANYGRFFQKAQRRKMSTWPRCLQCAAAGHKNCSLLYKGSEGALRCARCVRNGVDFCIQQNGDVTLPDSYDRWRKWVAVEDAPLVRRRKRTERKIVHNIEETFYVFCRDPRLSVEETRERAEALLQGKARDVAGVWVNQDDTRRMALPIWHKNDGPKHRDKPDYKPDTWQEHLCRVRHEWERTARSLDRSDSSSDEDGY